MSTLTESELELDCFDAFDSWFEELLDRTSPDLVVAIARGAVRLLQLRGFLADATHVKTYSHHALPFLSDEDLRGQRVLVFDDSIIYGSTMDEVSCYLAARGAIVMHAAFVADSTYFGNDRTEQTEHAWLNPKVKKFLVNEDVRRHHAALVQQVFHRGLDFNLDFPLITVKVDKLPANEIPFVAQLLRAKTAFADFHNVTYPASRFSGVERWTALHDWSPLPKNSSVFISQGNSKTRVTFVPEQNELRLKPIVQYALESGIPFSEIQFSNPEVNDFWRSLNFRLRDDDPYRNAALLRAVTFFGASVLGGTVLDDIEAAFAGEIGIHDTRFDYDDALLVLGPHLAQQFTELWTTIRTRKVCASETGPTPTVHIHLANGQELRQKIRIFCEEHEEFRPNSAETSVESLGKLFLAIQEVTDSPQVRQTVSGSNGTAELVDCEVSAQRWDARARGVMSASHRR